MNPKSYSERQPIIGQVLVMRAFTYEILGREVRWDHRTQTVRRMFRVRETCTLDRVCRMVKALGENEAERAITIVVHKSVDWHNTFFQKMKRKYPELQRQDVAVAV